MYISASEYLLFYLPLPYISDIKTKILLLNFVNRQLFLKNVIEFFSPTAYFNIVELARLSIVPPSLHSSTIGLTLLFANVRSKYRSYCLRIHLLG